ncbi:MAG: aminotransferase class I/II-fold pyridoxal phosphate-dependent enzyme [Desulfobacterales bacterium]
MTIDFFGAVPRRCVNLPPGSLKTLLNCAAHGLVADGPDLQAFYREFGNWIGVPHVFGASSGRTAFQLALEALALEKGAEIIFPAFTFPVMPMVAKMLGFKPVFCDVDPDTFNAGAEHIAAKVTGKTGAILATHLFGQPCPIREVAALAKERNIRLIEDCAHACGVRVGGQQVGTFGDIGVFSFAEGKNMPCFGGGVIVTANDDIARRAEGILAQTSAPPKGETLKKAVKIWVEGLLTRPTIFGLTVYPLLRLKGRLGQPLMDSVVGDDLLAAFARSAPRVSRLSNLQAAIGRRQIARIDAFNAGACRNAAVLTEHIGDVPGIQVSQSAEGNHIYVYYPLKIAAERRDDLRRFLLTHRIDSKNTDMDDCATLTAFRHPDHPQDDGRRPTAAAILEICVYPIIPQNEMRRIARVIRAWAGLAPR